MPPICDLMHRACFSHEDSRRRRGNGDTNNYNYSSVGKNVGDLERGESVVKNGVKIGMAYKK